MSAVRCRYHLNEARDSLTVALDHMRRAEGADVDPDRAAPAYADARANINYVDVLLMLREFAQTPDLDRETAAIDASREATT